MNMREKIARAISKRNGWNGCGKPCQPGNRECECLKFADAALEAMREPTDEMLMAGYKAPQGNQRGCDNKRELASAYMRGPFTAMIDAAREGK